MTKRIEHKNECFLNKVKENKVLAKDFIMDSINIRDEDGNSALYWALKYQNKENVQILLERNISLILSGNYHALTYAIDCDLCDNFIEISKRKNGKQSLFLLKDMFFERATIKKRDCILGYLTTL